MGRESVRRSRYHVESNSLNALTHPAEGSSNPAWTSTLAESSRYGMAARNSIGASRTALAKSGWLVASFPTSACWALSSANRYGRSWERNEKGTGSLFFLLNQYDLPRAGSVVVGVNVGGPRKAFRSLLSGTSKND